MLKKIVLSNRTLTRLAQSVLKRRLRRNKSVLFGKNVFIGRSSEFEGNNQLANHSSLTHSYIGFGSYLGENTQIVNTRIGRFTSIGPQVRCIFGKHPAETFVSTHPAFFSMRKQAGFTFAREQCFKEFEDPKDEKGLYSILIGNDVWIGYGVHIMDGVSIGDGAIVAANSLVTKDVEPYSIVGGIPAKHIKYRFDESQRTSLLLSKWWDKDPDWIRENADRFRNIDDFLKFLDND